MSKTLEFFFDVGSPASYLAWTQVPALCRQTGATLVCRPMLLGGVFQATGNASPAAIRPKGDHLNIDLARYARRYGVPLSINPHFPINTLMLMRAVTGVLMHEPERFAAFVDSVYHAIWVAALNLNDAAITAQALRDAGFDAGAIVAYANDVDVKARLRATTDEAVARGAFGAPTFFVEGEMFFGQDRLDFVREALS